MKFAISIAALLFLLILVGLTGCSGGGGGSNSSLAQHVGVYVTDDISSAFTSVVVTLYKVEISADGVTYTTVYSNGGGTSIDVSQLSSVVQLIGSASVPAGAYTKIRVTVGNTLSAIPIGLTAASTLTLSGTAGQSGQIVYVINSPETISDGSSIIVDFNLKQFTQSNTTVTAVLQSANPTDTSTDSNYATVVGTVSELSGGTFTLTLPTGDSVPVTVTANTSIVQSAGASAILSDNEAAEVVGPADPTTHTITATEVIVGVSTNAAYTTPPPSTGTIGTTTGTLTPPIPPSTTTGTTTGTLTPPAPPSSTTGTTTGTLTPPPPP